MIDVEKIEVLHIEWFGGEPFMYFEDVIVPISEYAIKKCELSHIPFKNTATTNGYYLKNSCIQELNRLHFSRFQITLDGPKDIHDKVKFMDGLESSFCHVLSNINNILNSSENIQILLRTCWLN